jgi:hypothetical protein
MTQVWLFRGVGIEGGGCGQGCQSNSSKGSMYKLQSVPIRLVFESHYAEMRINGLDVVISPNVAGG